MSITNENSQSLRSVWEETSADWIDWVRAPRDHDSFFWKFNLPNLLALLPNPRGLTFDLGCGEGRFTRELIRSGYRVVGCDGAPSLARACRNADPFPVFVADAGSLPIRERSMSLVTACMVLQDLDDLDAAIGEVARILELGGHFCFCILHPINTSGLFLQSGEHERFTFLLPYFKSRRYAIPLSKDNKSVTLHGIRRPLARYTRALEEAGFAIEALREPEPDPVWSRDEPEAEKWTRVPNALHVRAVRT